MARIFRERWNHHPDNATLSARQIPETYVAPENGGCFVQVACTYPDGSAHPGISRRPTAPWGGWVNQGYPFAPKGDTSARALIHRAIAQARQYIYIEDQFLVDRETSSVLLTHLPHIQALIILITQSDSVVGELFQPWRRRRDFLLPLLAAAPGKVLVRHGVTQYIHAKSLIFDDEFAIIGSANCSRRGYTHDSEVVAGIFDGQLEQRTLPKELRMRLWAKHLGVPIEQVADWRAGFALWASLPGSAHVAPYDPRAKNDPNPVPAPTPPPPGASLEQRAWYEFVRRISSLSGQVGVEQFWNIIIDPDGRASHSP
jgi:phosphatidylserine/phosphatidylglycerophosphate/cardiolipin synthase-like enzyme